MVTGGLKFYMFTKTIVLDSIVWYLDYNMLDGSTLSSNFPKGR